MGLNLEQRKIQIKLVKTDFNVQQLHIHYNLIIRGVFQFCFIFISCICLMSLSCRVAREFCEEGGHKDVMQKLEEVITFLSFI